MYKIYYSLTCLAMLILTSISYSQNLYNGPESVAFDTLNNRYLVSNVRNGTIVQVDSNGTQSYFATDLGACLGNCIAGDTFYVTNGNAILGYDLTTDQLVMTVESSTLRNLDGMTTDTSGYLYVLKTIVPVKIFKIDISNQTYSTFVSSGLTQFAQDLIFDKRSNQILVATWAANHPIQAVNLLDSTISTVITDSPGLYDGITMDADGFVYAASHNGGNIYMWDSSLTGSPRIISTGHLDPAGLDYNIRDNILAVPNFGGNTVDFIPCNIPALGLHGWTIDDSAGDDDGHADPGETGEITVAISNMAWDAHNVTGELSSDDEYISISAGMTGFGESPGWGETVTGLTPFALEISLSCPDPYRVPLELTITAEGGHAMTDTIYLFVGDTPGFEDDCEDGETSWSHDAMITGYTEEWHLDGYRAYNGSMCWKAGGPGAVHYSDMSDGVLITPPFLLPEEPVLRFWHWIDAEEDAQPGLAWDGGVVMISSGDGEWTQLMPIEGYTHSIVDNPASPFEVGTPCFSGNRDWCEEEFDLSGFAGVAQIMFRFGSDAAANAEGWYVDDIIIASAGCCVSPTGNVDGDPEDGVDLGDLTKLIDFLFISFTPPECIEEANIDGDPEGEVDLGDLTRLIDFLFISFSPPAECQ